jgi:hypothetical protein
MKRISAYVAALVMLIVGFPFMVAGYATEIVIDAFAFGRRWAENDADHIARRF